MNTSTATPAFASSNTLSGPSPKVGALYPQMLEIYQALAQMNIEFKEGTGVDYLVRLLMKVQVNEPAELVEKRFLKAFAPTQKATRLYSEYRGGITGAQKALRALARYAKELSNLAGIVNKDSTKIFAQDGLLCPDIIAYCEKNRSKVGIRQWIGLSAALGYSREETTALAKELSTLSQYAPVLEQAFTAHAKTIARL